MTIIMAVKDMILNGNLIHADEYIRADNPELFPQQKYVRNLTKDETAEILDEYVEYAQRLFVKEPEALRPGARTKTSIHKGQMSLPMMEAKR